MTIRLGVAMALAAVVLAGCGSTKEDRAISGGAIGAAMGNPLAGALLGGAAGAGAGAFTNPNQIDLGKPVWK